MGKQASVRGNWRFWRTCNHLVWRTLWLTTSSCSKSIPTRILRLQEEHPTPLWMVLIAAKAKARAVLMKKSEKAYSILLNLLEDELTDLIATVEQGDAYRVWIVLLETYETKSTASLCHKLDLLMNIPVQTRSRNLWCVQGPFHEVTEGAEGYGWAVYPHLSSGMCYCVVSHSSLRH